MTGHPAPRKRRMSRATVGTIACSRVTSLPRAAPKPPGSTKSRCMSITMRATFPGGNAYGNGVAATVIIVSVSGHGAADRCPVGISSANDIVDLAARHHRDTIGKLEDFLEILRDQQHGRPVVARWLERLHDDDKAFVGLGAHAGKHRGLFRITSGGNPGESKNLAAINLEINTFDRGHRPIRVSEEAEAFTRVESAAIAYRAE